jgi:hypothetical protein
MKTSSAKGKGRRLQQIVRDGLRAIGKSRGLVDEDIESTSMGVSGVDIRMSPAAKKVLGNLAVEAKNWENINVTGIFWQHAKKYMNEGQLPLLVTKKNHTEPLVTLRLADFLAIFERSLDVTA